MRTPNLSRKNYTLEFKNLVIKFAEETNNSKASINFGVPRTCIQSWRKMKLEYSDPQNNHKKRLKGGGRKLKNVELDEKMEEWMKEMSDSNQKVTGPMIQEHAIRISGNSEFKASKGWLQRLLVRHKFRQGVKKPGNSIPNLEGILKKFLDSDGVKDSGDVVESESQLGDVKVEVEEDFEVNFDDFEKMEDSESSEDVKYSESPNFVKQDILEDSEGVKDEIEDSEDSEDVRGNSNYRNVKMEILEEEEDSEFHLEDVKFSNSQGFFKIQMKQEEDSESSSEDVKNSKKSSFSSFMNRNLDASEDQIEDSDERRFGGNSKNLKFSNFRNTVAVKEIKKEVDEEME